MVGYGRDGFDRNQTICFRLNVLARAERERKCVFPLVAETLYKEGHVNAGYPSSFYSINSTTFAASLNHTGKMNAVHNDGHVESIDRGDLRKDYGWTGGVINVNGTEITLE